MSQTLNQTGNVVEALCLRRDDASGQFVLQLAGNVPAYLSYYDVSDELFASLSPFDTVQAVVSRVDVDGAGRESVILCITPCEGIAVG